MFGLSNKMLYLCIVLIIYEEYKGKTILENENKKQRIINVD